MASVIIGLALVDMLVSVNRLIRFGRIVKWHWAAPAASVLVVLTLIQIWWSLYRPEDRGITIGQFLPLFVQLVILFLLAAGALPCPARRGRARGRRPEGRSPSQRPISGAC